LFEDPAEPHQITLTATDADNDPVTWTISSNANHGTATVESTVTDSGKSNTISYQPNPNYYGSDTFEVKIEDDRGGIDTLIVNVTINPRNDPPVNTALPSISGQPNVGQTLTAVKGVWNDDIDQPNAKLTYSYQWQLSDSASEGSYTNISGATNKTYTVTRQCKEKFIRLEVTASDSGVGLPESQSSTKLSDWIFISNVTPVFKEKPPLIVEMDEDSNPRPFDLILQAIDPDDYTLTWKMTSDPSHGKTTIGEETGLTNTIMYQPASNYNGLDSFVIRISDKSGGETITVQVDIAAVNDPPNLTMTSSQPTPIEEDHYFDPISFDLKDIDNSQLTVSVDTDHSFFSNISICSGNTCKECSNNNCNIQFPFQTRSLTRALRIIQNMTGINNQLADEQDIDKNTLIGIPESIYYLRDTSSTEGGLSLRLTPTTNIAGEAPFTLYVTDASGATAPQPIDISVIAKVDGPILKVQDSTGDEDKKIKIDIKELELIDKDGSEILSDITIEGIPEGATLYENNTPRSCNGTCTVIHTMFDKLYIKPKQYDSDPINLKLSVSSWERTRTKNVKTVTENLTINVTPVANPSDVLIADQFSGDEDKKIHITFDTLKLRDSDRSEYFDRIELTNYPPNATYSAGYVKDNKRIIEFDDKEPTDIDKSGWDFTITPSGEDGEYYEMDIAVYSKEKDNNDTAVTTRQVKLSITKQTINEDVSGTCFISTTTDPTKSLNFLKYLIVFMSLIVIFQRLNIKRIIAASMVLLVCTSSLHAETISWQNVDYFSFKPMITMESLGSGQVDEVFLLETETSYSSPLGFQFGLGGIKKNNFILEATLDYISSFDDEEGGKSNSVDVINIMANAKYPYAFSDQLTGFGSFGLGFMLSQQDIGFRGKSVSIKNLGLSTRLGLGMDWKLNEQWALGMELTTNMGIGDVDFVKFSSLNLVARYYFGETQPEAHKEVTPEPEKPVVDQKLKERLESKIVQINSEIERIEQNNGSKHASIQLEQMKHYYKQAVSALEGNELDKAQSLIEKVESDKALVVNQMKKAVYDRIYRLNTYIGQLDSSADLGQVNELIEKAKSLAEQVEIVDAFAVLDKANTKIFSLLESVCYTAQEDIHNARKLIDSLKKTTNVDAQGIIHSASKHLTSATKAHTEKKCKDAITEALQAKNIAESAVSILINKDIREAAKKRIASAKKWTDESKTLADKLYETYGIKTPDDLQVILNHYAIAKNAFDSQQYDDAIKQANSAIKTAEKFMSHIKTLARQKFNNQLKSLEKQLNDFDKQIERMSFLVQPEKISVPDSIAQNAKRIIDALKAKRRLEILEKLKTLKSAQEKYQIAQDNLNAISIKPIHARVIIEAAGDDPKAIDFLKAREGLASYMQQLKKYHIDRKTIDLQPALGYQDQLQFLETAEEVKDSFPMFQADSSFRAQFKKAVHSFSYAEGLRRIVYIVSSRRTFIVPDDLENEIAQLKSKSREQRISFSCIYIYSGGTPRGKALKNMALKTNGKFYPCKTENDVRDALKDIFKQNQ
jgi:opacity protein-like surface antigen